MEPLSIDSVVVEENDEALLAQETRRSEAMMMEGSKSKGRHRLLNAWHRVGSSSTLVGSARPRSHSLQSGGKASMSCISLASPVASSSGQSLGSSYSSELSTGFSTAPTSATNSPPGSPHPLHGSRIRACTMTMTPDMPSSVPLPAMLRPMSRTGDLETGYFVQPVSRHTPARLNFNFWGDMPAEIRIYILQYLQPKEIVQCSVVSKSWHAMCFDGQLWSDLDTSQFYRDIPAHALVHIITSAGPFVKELNLRGCVQLREQWSKNGFVEACRNLENFTLEDCRIDRKSIHGFLLQNSRLVHVNLSGLSGVTNAGMGILAAHCPRVQVLNISWCTNIDHRGLRKVVQGCAKLRELKAGEVRGWGDIDLMVELFKRNTLERLDLTNCASLSDDSLTALMQGVDEEVDILANRPLVPPRKLKLLNLARCRNITDKGAKALIFNLPSLEGLNLAMCGGITDETMINLLPNLPVLTHLDMEELSALSNEVLKRLAGSPCAPHLKYLCLSYCEELGDAGMLPVLKACAQLSCLEVDNTRVSDLVLAEAAASIRARNRRNCALTGCGRPQVGLQIVAYDCANITWTGVREILSCNAERIHPSASSACPSPSYVHEIIGLRCFYNWQPTVKEHTERVLRGDFTAATRLERKWADWMMLNEEAGMGGAGARRRRRRAREAQLVHADEEEAGGTGAAGGMTRRRRARSGPGGCTVM